jgi:hypothetical protein
MCQTKPGKYSGNKSHSPKEPSARLSGYQINVLAALGELTLGQPVDRLKIGLQTGASISQVIRSAGWRGWYAGHTPSIINRCFIYLPGIQLANQWYHRDIQPWICFAGGVSPITSQMIIKPIVVSAIISPYVSLFEGLKLAQQLGYQRIYPQGIQSYINTGSVSVNPNTYQLIRGVIKSGQPRVLFAGFWPTFARETVFISGMCAIQPIITNTLAELGSQSGETNRVVGALTASLICQTISQPFDVLKTRREFAPTANWSLVIDSLCLDINKNGAHKILFSGWMPRCLRGVWTFYSISVIRDWLS